MQLIKPSVISGSIMTLLDEADKKVILVSPYCKFRQWHKLLKKFEQLQSRNIPVEFFVREGEHETIAEVESIGITPIEIPRLHAKLYMNEKTAISTSMNLHYSSEVNNIELAYQTETKKEYEELNDYYKRYLLPYKKKTPVVGFSSDLMNRPYFDEQLSNALSKRMQDKRIYVNRERNTIRINANGNRYDAHLEPNHFEITGILSGKEFDRALQEGNALIRKFTFYTTLNEGGSGYYDTISGIGSWPFNTSDFDRLSDQHFKGLIEGIVNFIGEVDGFKRRGYY